MTPEAIMIWFLLLTTPDSEQKTLAGIYRNEADCKWAGELLQEATVDYTCQPSVFQKEDKK